MWEGKKAKSAASMAKSLAQARPPSTQLGKSLRGAILQFGLMLGRILKAGLNRPRK